MVALFVVCTVAFFLVVDLIVSARAKSRAESEHPRIAGFELATDRLYHAGHTWAKKNAAGLHVGLDQFAARLIGPPESVELPAIGARVEAGRPMATVVRRGRRTMVVAPISGRVAAINRVVERKPEIVWADPFGAGWLAAVESDRMSAESEALKAGEAARAWLDDSALALHQLFAPQGALRAAADGGRPVDSVADLLDDAAWRKVRSQFLLTDGA